MTGDLLVARYEVRGQWIDLHFQKKKKKKCNGYSSKCQVTMHKMLVKTDRWELSTNEYLKVAPEVLGSLVPRNI